MATVGEAIIQIGAEGADGARSALESVGSALGKLGGIAIGVAGAGFAAVAGGLALATSEAMESQDVLAQLSSVLQSTKSDVPIEEFANYASALQGVTKFTDEAILAGDTILAQFKTIGADTMPAATSAVLDFATRFGMDVPSAARLVGKALADPAAGFGLLSRYLGKIPADTQKAIDQMIKMGDTAGAQTAILGLLNSAVGGAAEAAGKTFSGQLEIAKNKLLEVAEAAGMKMLPSLTKLLDAGLPLATMMASSLADGAASLTSALSVVTPTIERLAQVAGGAFANLRAGMPVMELLSRLFPGVFSPEVKAAIDSIGGSLSKIGDALSPALAGFVSGLGDALKASFGENGGMIIDNITGAFSNLASFLQTNGPAIAGAAQFIGQTIGAAIGGIVTIVSGVANAFSQLLTGDFQGALATLGNTLTGFANGVSQAFGGVDFSVVLGQWGGILANAGTIISATAGNAIGAASAWASGVLNAIGSGILSIPGMVTGAIDGAIQAAVAAAAGAAAAGAALGQGFANGIKGMIGAVIAAAVSAIEAAIAAAKAAAGISSPSKVMAEMGGYMAQGLAIGITDQAALAIQAMNNLSMATMQPAMSSAPSQPAAPVNQSRDTYHINITAQNGASLQDLIMQARQMQAGG